VKYLLISLLSVGLFLPSFYIQEPAQAKKDQIYVEFDTDCNWLVYGLQGKIKLHPQRERGVGFRAWKPYLKYGTIDLQGFVMWKKVSLYVRDYYVSPWSSYKAEFGEPPIILWGLEPKWTYVIHYNEKNGRGVPNADTHMRVWGPCEIVRLMHGEATITHGDETFTVKVDENDYVNYPPWEIVLK